MINLTQRLASIASEIKTGETVADIGTDHGFLPIFLWERNISPKVIMSDISKGSLKKAEDNCRLLYPDVRFDLRLGSGIDVIEEGEVDCITMAGMGGLLMTEILSKDVEKSRSYKKLVLQPRNKIGILRHWLYNNGFSISNEKLVREGKFICEIITVLPKECAVIKSMGPDRIEYQYPHSLVDFKGPLTEEYLNKKLRAEKVVLESMMKSKNVTSGDLKKRIYRIDYLERLINKL